MLADKLNFKPSSEFRILLYNFWVEANLRAHDPVNIIAEEMKYKRSTFSALRKLLIKNCIINIDDATYKRSIATSSLMSLRT